VYNEVQNRTEKLTILLTGTGNLGKFG